jgi:hypothetical protein
LTDGDSCTENARKDIYERGKQQSIPAIRGAPNRVVRLAQAIFLKDDLPAKLSAPKDKPHIRKCGVCQ